MSEAADFRVEWNKTNRCDLCSGTGKIWSSKPLSAKSCPRCGGDGILERLPDGKHVKQGRVIRSTRGLT